VALLSIMFVCFIIQIFFRYVLSDPVGWTEEVIVTTWLWTVLWGASFIVGEAEEIRFDIIYSNISEPARRLCTAATGVTLVLLYGISLPASWRYVSFMKVEHSAYLHVPINLMYSVYIVFVVACICRYSWLVYRAIRGGPSPLTDAARLKD
jgi:TRAP-type C4-dicarboxylate transport system permease small subunit